MSKLSPLQRDPAAAGSRCSGDNLEISFMPQQFVVPQFIDVEAKILGPITMRQFIIMLAALFIEFIVFKLSDFALFIVLSIVIIPLAGAISFMKINGKPIHYFLLNFFQSLKKPKRRVWDKTITNEELKQFLKKPASIEEIKIVSKAPLAGSHLAELSLIVDTGGVYRGEDILEVKHK
jgi:hypothetical protein